MSALGWLVAVFAVLCLLRVRGRSELVACAAHELRGAATNLELVRSPDGMRLGLDRLRCGLDDLDAARHGRRATAVRRALDVDAMLGRAAEAARLGACKRGRAVTVEVSGGERIDADPGRMAQALGNLIDNALEHGEGDVHLSARAEDEAVRIEVADDGSWVHRVPIERRPGRGRGLQIAARAGRDAGGRLSVAGDRSAVSVELPRVRA